MKTRKLKTRVLALWAALALLAASAAAARLASADADESARARAHPGIVLHARGVISLGSYELNLAFSADGHPVRVSVCRADEG